MPEQARVAVLFADVCGSTQLYDMMGDARARAVLARCIAAMTEATRRAGGVVVKTIGDEVMATFPTADAAAEAACAMQEAITGRLVADGRPIAIRIGFHVGDALIEEADLFGEAVNLPARLAGEAKAGQILTSAAAVAEIGAARREACRRLALVRIRGKVQPVAIFELVWRPEEATVMRGEHAAEQSGARLLVSAGGSIVELSEVFPALTIGRAEQNDIVVRNPLVSRLHARIEYRQGRFVLSDLSANGTWVVADDGASSFVHRDTEVLTGSGRLGLGEAATGASPCEVRYAAGLPPAFPLGAPAPARRAIGTTR